MRAVGSFVVIVVIALSVGAAVKFFWPNKKSGTESWREAPLVACPENAPKWQCAAKVEPPAR
jgi:hypothetical protein